MFVKAVSFGLDLMGLFFIDAPVIFGADVGGQSAVTTAVFYCSDGPGCSAGKKDTGIIDQGQLKIT